jgi:hypothetical protein
MEKTQLTTTQPGDTGLEIARVRLGTSALGEDDVATIEGRD